MLLAPHADLKPTKRRKKPSGRSPTQNSLDVLRARGLMAQVVEHWHPFTHQRVDLFGCIDIVMIHRDTPGATGIQCCRLHDAPARRDKGAWHIGIQEWVRAGNHFLVWGWETTKDGRRWIYRGVQFEAFWNLGNKGLEWSEPVDIVTPIG